MAGVVGLHVDTKDDMLFKVISSVNVLAMDLVSNVRLACGRVGCEWMLNLRDRYSFFGHILPMVLLGFVRICKTSISSIQPNRTFLG